MNVETMRREIAGVYSGEKWKKRVKQMPENQVLAVYNTFVRTDRFKKQKEKEEQKPLNHKQLTFADISIGYDESSGKDRTVLVLAELDGDTITVSDIYYDEEARQLTFDDIFNNL